MTKIADTMVDRTQLWLERAGLRFVCILFRSPSGEIIRENHVNDLDTIALTVRHTMIRIRAQAAVYPTRDGWVLERRHTLHDGETIERRFFDSKEAAEMLLIHGG